MMKGKIMPSIDINFNNNYGIYIFVYLLLPFLFFYKAKIINFTNSNVLSLSSDTNNQLKGLFILVVILHHIALHMDSYGLLSILRSVGYLAVSVFFFISGVGLSKSLIRNPKYLDRFLYKKFLEYIYHL